MKLRQKRFLAFAVLAFTVLSSAFAGDICESCTKVGGMPVAQSALGALEKVAYATTAEPGQKEYMSKYCLTFQQIGPEYLSSTLDEMEKTPFPMDDYFKLPQCQSEGYSLSTKSPLIHVVADDPTSREEFLNKIWFYYNKKKKPTAFTEALNSKNTKGETLLDYIETLKKNNTYTEPEQFAVLKKIIEYACSHGGTYSAYKNTKCPTTKI